MSPAGKLLAAAERLEQLVTAIGGEVSPLPWSIDEPYPQIIDDLNCHVAQTYTAAESELIVATVNAAPAMAALMRFHSRDLPMAARLLEKSEEFVAADPLYSQVLALAEQILAVAELAAGESSGGGQ